MSNTKKIGRGRPRAFCAETALAAATDLFRQKGYDAVTIAELCDATGLKPPSLYAAFGAKRDLFERAVELSISTTGHQLVDSFTGEADVARAIAAVFEKAAELYARDRGGRACLVMEGTINCSDPAVSDMTARVRREMRDTVADRITAFAPGEAETLADFVMLGIAGISAAARDGVDEATLRESAKILAEGARQRLETSGPVENDKPV
ncbi:TetR/AcrR family transcriptional regulator [Jiella pacifica]|uniref:TetR family transcriptional regulator n=1 Tax=Jiella pacifica TaxID=2696469 RepID=A0A6N9T5U7_9HYPH|nr:TetR/AcrR family transcriptional regulator [Jiella pacifica]NDW05575.1 TetR family transcriptional regulator [Jiella pacifica]